MTRPSDSMAVNTSGGSRMPPADPVAAVESPGSTLASNPEAVRTNCQEMKCPLP